MKDAADYLAYIKALIVAHPQVAHCAIQREEAQGDEGLLRVRLTLRDGGLLELCERFTIASGRVRTIKYRFHWQDATGQLRKRWDNAAHHPEMPIYPDHVHEGAETNVLPHRALSAAEVLAMIAPEAESPDGVIERND